MSYALIVERDNDLREALVDALGHLGQVAIGVGTLARAIACFEEQTPSLLLVDGEIGGVADLLRAAYDAWPRIGLISLGGEARPPALYLRKPFDFAQLATVLRQCRALRVIASPLVRSAM